MRTSSFYDDSEKKIFDVCGEGSNFEYLCSIWFGDEVENTI